MSTLGQADGYSLETQREACELRARSMGAEDIIFLEDTFTGTSLDRPAMEQFRAHVKEQSIQLIVVYDPDRLSRDLNDLLIVTKEIDRAGIELVFVNFDWQNTHQGMLFLQLRGAIAQFEHAMIKERTQRGKTKKAAKGKLRTWAQPYGYLYDSQSSGLVLHPEQASIVFGMFQWVLEEGLSSVRIAQRLAAKGIPGPTGKGWDYTTVQRILRRTTYYGVMTRKDERPDWEPIRVPAIVSNEMWDQVQERICTGRKFSKGRTKGLYLLRGLLKCGHCGGPLSVAKQTRTKGEKTAEYAYYRCMRHKRRKFGEDADEICPLKDLRTDALDQVVWDRIMEMALHPDEHILKNELEGEPDVYRERIAEANGKLQKAQQQLKRTNTIFRNGGYDPEDEERNEALYTTAVESLKTEIQGLREEVQTYEQVILQKSNAEKTAHAVRSWAEGFRSQVAEIPFDAKVQIVRRLVQSIKIGNDTVEVHGHFWLQNPQGTGGPEEGEQVSDREAVVCSVHHGTHREEGGHETLS